MNLSLSEHTQLSLSHTKIKIYDSKAISFMTQHTAESSSTADIRRSSLSALSSLVKMDDKR